MDGDERDRDQDGRARNARPRDDLGRPLPHGLPGVERQPEGVARTPDEALTEAQRLLDDGKPFHAHEVLEDAWKASAEPERELWRGLAQLAVGLTHALRGNPKGARALLDRAARNLEPFVPDPPHGVDVAGLIAWTDDPTTTPRLTGTPRTDPGGTRHTDPAADGTRTADPATTASPTDPAPTGAPSAGPVPTAPPTDAEPAAN
ncbi:DUF309 domain-containing protein [Actinosynnema sp. NPDC020468]|uniref:DUF309 domain-containing protein n=1 Tax=Actinosynnema sp. NPDC020468 TaxID=3154488 RepID=UPI0033C23107